MSSSQSDVEALASLGTGGSDDRLSFGLILKLFRRSTTLLRPVRKHLALLFLGFSLSAGIAAVVGAPLAIAFSNSVLVGSPPTALEAGLLGLGPEYLDAASRMEAQRKALQLLEHPNPQHLIHALENPDQVVVK